jgi:hypothetical protein
VQIAKILYPKWQSIERLLSVSIHILAAWEVKKAIIEFNENLLKLKSVERALPLEGRENFHAII